MIKIKKTTALILPVIIVLILAAITLSASYLKQPFNETDDVVKYIEKIRLNLQRENWSQAEEDTSKLNKAWEIVLGRIQYSASKGDIDKFSSKLFRLRGAISVKDKKTALIELTEAEAHWNNLGKLY